jgi:hypothetical protein
VGLIATMSPDHRFPGMPPWLPSMFLPVSWFLPPQHGLPPPVTLTGDVLGVGGLYPRRKAVLEHLDLPWRYRALRKVLPTLANGTCLVHIHSNRPPPGRLYNNQELATHRLTQAWGACVATETCFGRDALLCNLFIKYDILAMAGDPAVVVETLRSWNGTTRRWRAVPDPLGVRLQDIAAAAGT